MLRRSASITTILALALGFVGYSVAPLNASQEMTVTMDITGFSPASIEVETGTTVTWINASRLNYPVLRGAHQLEASDGSFASEEIAPGGAFTKTFNEPFTASYVCKIHPTTMSGTISVVGDPVVPPATEKTVKIVEGSSTDTATWGFEPQDLKIEVGTTVIFRNQGATDHTATAEDGSFDSGFLRGGQSFSFTFTESTAINYFCEPHPWMTGTIVVSKPGEAPPKVPTKKPPGGGGSNNPPPVVVQPPVRSGNQPATWPAQIVEGSISDPQSWGYQPDSMTVQAGDTVQWTNAGSIGHTVTAADGTFDSGDLASGDVFSFTFPNTGTFNFSCKPHPWMTGVIQVVPAGTDVKSVAPPTPAAPTVEPPGGTTSTPGEQSGADPSTRNISDSAATGAWTLGAVGLAAGTGIAIFLVGALITALGALQLVRQRKDAPADQSYDAGMTVIDLTETQVKVATEAPVLVGAAVIEAGHKEHLDSARGETTARRAAPQKATSRKAAAPRRAKPRKAAAGKASVGAKATAGKKPARRSTAKRGAGSSAGGSRVR
ncbi:MAG: plastocyanin/azurin family copper-binding protein [Actinomycetota bacterium]